jgi:hypothetical protein
MLFHYRAQRSNRAGGHGPREDAPKAGAWSGNRSRGKGAPPTAYVMRGPMILAVIVEESAFAVAALMLSY